MKKLLFIMLIFLFGCNHSSSTSNKSEEDNSESISFPTNEYFQITSVSKGRYIEHSKFEMEFEITNVSDYKFSLFYMGVDIYYKMKNSEEYCLTTVQADDMEPHHCIVRDWEPHTTKHFYFVSPGYGSPAACYAAQYSRTPEEIVMEIIIDDAISVDTEVKGVLVRLDLLDLWIERQKQEGLR